MFDQDYVIKGQPVQPPLSNEARRQMLSTPPSHEGRNASKKVLRIFGALVTTVLTLGYITFLGYVSEFRPEWLALLATPLEFTLLAPFWLLLLSFVPFLGLACAVEWVSILRNDSALMMSRAFRWPVRIWGLIVIIVVDGTLTFIATVENTGSPVPVLSFIEVGALSVLAYWGLSRIARKRLQPAGLKALPLLDALIVAVSPMFQFVVAIGVWGLILFLVGIATTVIGAIVIIKAIPFLLRAGVRNM